MLFCVHGLVLEETKEPSSGFSGGQNEALNLTNACGYAIMSDTDTIIVLAVLLAFFVVLTCVMCCSYADIVWLRQLALFKKKEKTSGTYSSLLSQGSTFDDVL